MAFVLNVFPSAGVLKETVSLCVSGASIRDICIKADARMEEETGKAFKKDKKVGKGIAFPCCLSVNNCICHYSPLMSEPDVCLKDGDLVKLDMGAHIDGFIAVVAHSLVVGATKDNKVKGKKADALMAAHLASEAALRLVKPGNEVRRERKMILMRLIPRMICTISLGLFMSPRPGETGAEDVARHSYSDLLFRDLYYLIMKKEVPLFALT